MHGATIKIINAQQARLNNIYKNTKLKLLKNNAAILFNQICRNRQLKHKYISFKINGWKQQIHLPPCTRNNAHNYRICCHNNIITKKFVFLTH